ncbi:MAG TPA: LPXTG cell wall anchor domain-containing protein [Chloroflexia bacterium]|nr:LPXTG cell wall anchor domain-containing protein [Chloroflexia bacterium]
MIGQSWRKVVQFSWLITTVFILNLLIPLEAFAAPANGQGGSSNQESNPTLLVVIILVVVIAGAGAGLLLARRKK